MKFYYFGIFFRFQFLISINHKDLNRKIKKLNKNAENYNSLHVLPIQVEILNINNVTICKHKSIYLLKYITNDF